MAYTTIDKPTDYFETKLYAGSSSNVTVSGLDFQPDWIWLKNRTNVDNHVVCDVVRGGNSNGLGNLYPNLTDSEYLPSSTNDSIETINSDGFVVGGNGNTNGSGENFVSWSWKAGGTASSNTDGSITSSVSANTTAGFSIVSYTGTGSAGTVGHGLGSAPKMIICKTRSAVGEWITWHTGIDIQAKLSLNTNDAVYNPGNNIYWNGTLPTSSVFSIGTSGSSNGSGTTYIAYCFADTGNKFFKADSYTGNGSTDGTFVYTGFKPAWLMVKRTDIANSWVMFDNKRSSSGGFNEIDYSVNANSNGAEETSNTSTDVDFCSNGIKITEDNGAINASGGTYIYMCFASSPFVTSTGIPTVAR